MKVIAIILAALIFSVSPVFASNLTSSEQEASFSATYSAQMSPTGNDIGVSKITPASFFYFLKTVRENIELKLALTPHVKKIRQLEFATRRLREIKSLIGGREDLIQPTMERYWFHLNQLDPKDDSDPEVVVRVKESLTVHLEVLQSLYDKLTNPKAKLSIRSVINRMTLRSDLPIFVKIPACYFLQKEATDSALAEGEREILLQRAQNCFKGTGHTI